MDEQIDSKLVDEAAEFVEQAMARRKRNALQAALSIGDYLFERFFGKDPLSISSRGHDSPSLQALMAHPRIMSLGLSYRTVAYYIRVAVQKEELDRLVSKGKLTEDVQALNYSQRAALLPAKTTRVLVTAATQAVKGGLTRDEIKILVAKLNGQKGSGSRQRSPVEQAIRELLAQVEGLLGLDLSAQTEDDLGWLEAFVPRLTARLELLGERVEVEAASRGGAPPATVMSNWAAKSPDDVDTLLDEMLDGGRLGVGEALKAGALDVVRHLGNRLLANARYADGQPLSLWWESFRNEISEVLPAAPERIENGQEKSAQAGQDETGTQSRLLWYAVYTYVDIPGPEEVSPPEDWMTDGYYYDRAKRRCIVQARSAKEAADIFRKEGLPLLEDGELIVDADLLSSRLKTTYQGTRIPPIREYLELERNKRLPTLAEFVSEPREASRLVLNEET